MRTAVCVLVKNEERHIAEWVAYQFVIGFDSVLAVNNNSSDRTTQILSKLGRVADVRTTDWPSHDRSTQAAAYTYINNTFGAEYDWIAYIDSDEFLVPRAETSIVDLVSRHPNRVAIGLNWLMFGSSGHVDFPSGLVLESFLHRGDFAWNLDVAGPDFVPNKHIKSIIRPKFMQKPANPHFFFMEGEYVDAWGRPMPWDGTPGIAASVQPDADWFVHHYFIRSRAHWGEKMVRGYHDGTIRTEQEFAWYDRNEVYDDSALRFVPRVKAFLEQLD